MNRRRFLSLAVPAVAGLAGCVGDGASDAPSDTGTRTAGESPTATPSPTATIPGPRAGDELPEDPNPEDGYPPAFENAPEPRSVNVDAFETVSRNGEEVPLAPIEVAYNWYVNGEARFADARGPGQYESSHIFSAVSSPAGNDDEDDPVEDWPTSDRIVCYCGCPHHLSSMRAADLLADGYTNVCVIDEGFWEWTDRDFPVVGENVSSRPPLHVIEGRVAERFAGETAWVSHDGTEQVEATEIDADGRYVLEVRFSGVEPATEITIETPAYRKTAPLSELSTGVITA